MRLPLVAALLCLPLVSACALTLDFEELQGGASRDSDDAGMGGSGGAGGGGSGAGGGLQCEEDCDDGDDCTVDTCTPSGCEHTEPGLFVPDGLDTVVRADTLHRATMISRGDAFYLSAFKEDGGVPDVALYRFDTTATDVGSAMSLTGASDFLGLVPVSAAGMVSDDSDLSLAAFTAFGTERGAGALVWRVDLTLTLDVIDARPVSASPNYQALNPQTYPIAFKPPGGPLTSAWPGLSAAGGGVHVYTGSTLAASATPALGAGLGPVAALTPLFAGSRPGALFLVNGTTQVQAQGQGAPQELAACDARPGTLTSADAAYSGVSGIFTATWTKRVSGGYVSQFKPVLCADDTALGPVCIAGDSCEASDDVLSGVRNIDGEFITLQGDPVGRVYQFNASSVIDPSRGEAHVVLQGIRANFDAEAGATPRGADILAFPQDGAVLSTTTVDSQGQGGADFPVIAVIPPDRLAVAWIQPGDAGDALHVQRHRVCFPNP